jgi:hypothetical protein
MTHRPLPTARELRLEIREPEPDPADVDALAAAIHAGTGCCDGAPSENHRSAARTALRWMKDREAGRG